MTAMKHSSPAQPGRRKAEAGSRAELRRAAFLEAAREVFLEQGYEAANMSEIVRRAGGSLATLYAQFGDKEGIFLAMLEARMAEFTEALEVELKAHTPIAVGLTRIGEQYARKLVQPQSLELYRLIVGLARKFPDIARRFLDRGPNALRAALAAYLEDRQAAGEIEAGDFEQLASMFLDMVRSGIQTRALLDSTIQPTEADVSANVERAVSIFLNGVAARR
ncbi:MAG: TetR/AcrR family transcriptional regulator [Hyphomonas sp.]|uniref:TetR/AcrR family transcriptional regulator n=1 Tax=Hyphomonas sp. TaxID=87 RepID=UPI003527BF30